MINSNKIWKYQLFNKTMVSKISIFSILNICRHVQGCSIFKGSDSKVLKGAKKNKSEIVNSVEPAYDLIDFNDMTIHLGWFCLLRLPSLYIFIHIFCVNV